MAVAERELTLPSTGSPEECADRTNPVIVRHIHPDGSRSLVRLQVLRAGPAARVGSRVYAPRVRGRWALGKGSEAFVRPQVAPLTRRQLAQRNAADADAFDHRRSQAHELTHALDLPVSAFMQDDAQLLLAKP